MTTISITGFDHLVLRCADVEASLAWYRDELGLAPLRVEEWRAGQVPFPSVRVSAETIIDLIPTTGPVTERNLDHLCLVAPADTVAAIDAGRDRFRVVSGPITRYGARGDGLSIYVLDPDDYLVEVRTYDDVENTPPPGAQPGTDR